VAVFRFPRFEPVGADRAEGTVRGNFVEVEFDDERVKIIDNIGAARDGAGQVVLAWRGIVDPNSAVVLYRIGLERRPKKERGDATDRLDVFGLVG